MEPLDSAASSGVLDCARWTAVGGLNGNVAKTGCGSVVWRKITQCQSCILFCEPHIFSVVAFLSLFKRETHPFKKVHLGSEGVSANDSSGRASLEKVISFDVSYKMQQDVEAGCSFSCRRC